MFPQTPTLPTVIITPSTPLYLLPTNPRQSKSSSRSSPRYSHTSPSPFTYASSPSSSSPSSSSSSRGYTRKQHLVSALGLDSSPLPHPDHIDEKSSNNDFSINHNNNNHQRNYDLLHVPSSNNLPAKKSHRRTGGLLLSLLVFGLFGLVLIGPILPYKMYMGYNTDGIESTDQSSITNTVSAISVDDGIKDLVKRTLETFGPGQGGSETTLDVQAFGPGQDQMPSRRSTKKKRTHGQRP